MSRQWKVTRTCWLGYWAAATIINCAHDRGPEPMFFPKHEQALEYALSGGAVVNSEGLDLYQLLWKQRFLSRREDAS